eukprot:CAMPEP_0117685822 /NCGR_PEP_ID=MMETSP0804-20121206/22008_1 /TAXON_ID=1074897 /ORGANISM="Tetraselmis astigmatica, Strain CCMP880" /LENGTH=44 /DNA_ID= /DNA_START= /DNA_END= /DNA_ORIENTATION=
MTQTPNYDPFLSPFGTPPSHPGSEGGGGTACRSNLVCRPGAFSV